MKTQQTNYGPIHQPGMFNIESFDGQQWRGGMNRAKREDAIQTAMQWAAQSGRRYRVFDPDEQLVFDTEADTASGTAEPLQ